MAYVQWLPRPNAEMMSNVVVAGYETIPIPKSIGDDVFLGQFIDPDRGPNRQGPLASTFYIAISTPINQLHWTCTLSVNLLEAPWLLGLTEVGSDLDWQFVATGHYFSLQKHMQFSFCLFNEQC